MRSHLCLDFVCAGSLGTDKTTPRVSIKSTQTPPDTRAVVVFVTLYGLQDDDICEHNISLLWSIPQTHTGVKNVLLSCVGVFEWKERKFMVYWMNCTFQRLKDLLRLLPGHALIDAVPGHYFVRRPTAILLIAMSYCHYRKWLEGRCQDLILLYLSSFPLWPYHMCPLGKLNWKYFPFYRDQTLIDS